MSVVIPYTFVSGNKARAAEVNANFAAVAAKFTEGSGGIKDEDISTSAGIKRTKLSTVAGSRITEAQIEDDAVDSRVLKDDATAGSPNAAVATADHIKDGIITNAKLFNATVKKGKLNIASVTITIGGLGAANYSDTDTTLLSTGAFPVLWEIEAAGVAPAIFPALFMRLDTATNKYWMHAINANDANPSVSFGLTIYYIVV